MTFRVPEKFRLREYSSPEDGNNGAFSVQLAHGQRLFVVASDGGGWEHVSASRKDRLPTWTEMCQLKSMFWDDCDVVMQLHPRRDEYVNNHPNCLHLWRPTDREIPTPPSIFVGVL
jgi:hypothetical protein